MSETDLRQPEIVLTPPPAVPELKSDQAVGMIALPPEKRAELVKKAEEFVAAWRPKSRAARSSPARSIDIARMGEKEIRSSADVSNRMLERPASSLAVGARARRDPPTRRPQVARTLQDLRTTITDLDPGHADLTGPKGVLGRIPGGRRLMHYFERYQPAQKHLDAIITALISGQDELLKDNAAIELERANLWKTMGKLGEYATLAAALDDATEARIARASSHRPEDGRHPDRRRAVPDPSAPAGPDHADRRVGAGLPRPRRRPQEQPGAHQGRRTRPHDHRLSAPHRRDRRPGAREPAAGARPDQRAQRRDELDDRPHRRTPQAADDDGPRRGRVVRRQRRDAPARLRQRLRDDGRDRRLPRKGGRDAWR